MPQMKTEKMTGYGLQVRLGIELRGELVAGEWSSGSSAVQFAVTATGLDAPAVWEGRHERGGLGDPSNRVEVRESRELGVRVDADRPWIDVNAELRGEALSGGLALFG